MEKFSHNPFLAQLKQFMKRKKRRISAVAKSDISMVNNKTGEIHNVFSASYVTSLQDGRNFTKIFPLFTIKARLLNKQGTQLIYQIIDDIPYERDKIVIVSTSWGERMHCDESQVRRGIQNLVKHEFLAKTKEPFHYWINVGLFFKGDPAKILEL